MAAPYEKLQELHATLADAFTNLLRDGVKSIDKDGNVVMLPLSPAYLNNIRQFLNDNGIEAVATPGSPVERLSKALPFTAPHPEISKQH